MQMNEYNRKRLEWARGIMAKPRDPFQEWLNRPVYKTQCFTTKLAHAICGLNLGPNEGLATSLDTRDPLFTFHALPPYRTPEAKALRKQIADQIRAARQNRVTAT
jgi:hypothetical protein